MPPNTRAGALWQDILATGRADGRLVEESLSKRGAATLLDPPKELHPDAAKALKRAGIEQLYSHQAVQALTRAWEGPFIVTTGTASGKSLCFNLPTLDVLSRDPRARAIYLYPTKALAQDQARMLGAFGMQRLRPAIYDGDTPRQARSEIRRSCNVVLTNPDMLHVGILPNHEAWADLFANLAIVVVDEAHVYRGVFGSHVGNVLRRLRRIANAYRTTPRFLLASATIANPVELAERLTGIEDFALIEQDGAPTPARQIAMWNPPLTDERSGARASAAAEGAELLAKLVLNGARCICFVRSRRGVELLSKLARQLLEAEDPRLAQLIAPYRAGYTPQQRREIEARLTSGELRAVVSTDALELGISIGELDAAIVVNFPGTVASLRQMWGRAGRRGRGLAVYVAGEDALDQFFCRHPPEFLERPVEAAILDHESQQIHPSHLLCAAYEGPLSASDAEFLGPRWEAYAELLVGACEPRMRDGRSAKDGRGARDSAAPTSGPASCASVTSVAQRMPAGSPRA